MSITDLFLRDAQHSKEELDQSNEEFVQMKKLFEEITALKTMLAEKEAQYHAMERSHYYTASQAINCAMKAKRQLKES